MNNRLSSLIARTHTAWQSVKMIGRAELLPAAKSYEMYQLPPLEFDHCQLSLPTAFYRLNSACKWAIRLRKYWICDRMQAIQTPKECTVHTRKCMNDSTYSKVQAILNNEYIHEIIFSLPIVKIKTIKSQIIIFIFHSGLMCANFADNYRNATIE